MSLDWMLLSGLVLLLLIGGYLVLRTVNQGEDYSLAPEQRYELASRNYGDRANENRRYIDVAQNPRLSTLQTVFPDTASLPSPAPAKSTAPTSKLEPPPTAIRRIFINGAKVYDGKGANRVTIRISNKGDAYKREEISMLPIGSEVPTRGLIINPEPLEKILSGMKTLELRKKNNKTRGRIALIQKGSGKIIGFATIGDSVGPMTFSDFTARIHEHGVEPHRLRLVFDDGYVVGWKLSEVGRLRTPVSYVHKAGAVIWVALDDADRAALHAAMAST